MIDARSNAYRSSRQSKSLRIFSANAPSISFKSVSTGYTVFDKNGSKYYFTDLKCPYCNSDLSKKDRLELEKARKENKLVAITMF